MWYLEPQQLPYDHEETSRRESQEDHRDTCWSWHHWATLTNPQHPTTSKLLIIREIKPYLFKPWKPGFLFPAAEYTWYRQVSILGLFLIQQTLTRHSRGSMYSLYVQAPRFRPNPYFSLELCSCVSTSPQACVTGHVWHFHYQHLCCKSFCCITNWLQSNFAIKDKNHKK